VQAEIEAEKVGGKRKAPADDDAAEELFGLFLIHNIYH
jgi:hypothetical protein